MVIEARIPSEFQPLVDELMERHAPSGKISIVKDLVGGRSPAAVFLVDIDAASARPSAEKSFELSGQFVLKLERQRIWDQPEPDESARHQAAWDRNAEFSAEHMPQLLGHVERDHSHALLYQIAGHSLVSLVTADSLDAGALKHFGSEVIRALLSDWNRDHSQTALSARQLLEQWLGYRLQPDLAPELHKFLLEEAGDKKEYISAERVLTNPLWLCNAPFMNEATQTRIIGTLHGDLHPGNLLLERNFPYGNRFWLIDFALSRDGPLCYDSSYLELALLLHYLQGAGPERMLGILEALDAAEDDPKSAMVPVQDMGLLQCLRAMRHAADKWQKEAQPNRHDPYLAQQFLSRVAVSLNWCNKPLEVSARRLALAYGAWASWRYVRTFHESEWRGSSLPAATEAEDTRTDDPRGPTETPKRWTEFWDRVGKFDAALAKFVLVTDRLKGDLGSASLGMLPWSAVIDLDVESDIGGLYSGMGDVLEKSRSLQQYGREGVSVDFDRGTAWLMAGGWPSRHEPVPASLREWRRLYMPVIRDLSKALRQAVSPQAVHVLVLSNNALSNEHLARTLETIDEQLGDLSTISILGIPLPIDSSIDSVHFGFSPDEFVSAIRRMYGTEEAVQNPQIPGADGFVTIPLDQLRNLEEDLEIVHTRILAEEAFRQPPQDGFWRGNPPSWSDLHASLDITREIYPELLLQVEGALAQSRNHTVELHHTPGAGGTTIALRIAWTLRNTYPTAVLRRYSRLSLDRIDQLFQLTQKPVLLIAEASELPASAREELYRGLVGRNSRVVILYVARTIRHANDKSLGVYDPMPLTEAKAFLQRYVSLAKHPKQKQLLRRLAAAENEYWQRYCSPFFYGLITFEREFTSIERYVEAHLNGISHRIRQTILYLALITRYSQVGLDEALLLSLLGLRSDARLDVNATFGDGPAQLIVRQGRQFKLLHPLIAEEVLRELLGGDAKDGWKYGVKELSFDLINDVVRVLGSDSIETNRLFVQLFIQRDVWYEREAKGRPRFSELITTIPNVAGQSQVLELLTNVCPTEAHYWNHLGRHHFYEVKQDFDQAELLLQKAVELSPDDAYHHHSLGMVRRFWIERTLTEMLQEQVPPTPAKMLSTVESLVSSAARSFTKARELSPDDDHGFVTHMQMLLFIAERLVRASGGSLGAASKKAGEVSSWLASNLVVAEELLARVQHQRGQGKQSRYELRCVSQLSGLYEDFDEIINTWESLLERSSGQTEVRRALAFAYYARVQRVWSAVPSTELRRVVSMMEANLRDDPTNDRDIRSWFQAYRRLPEYSHLEAVDRLGAWASRADSLDAFFYLYILHFLRLQEGSSRSEDAVLDSLEKCRQLARGRRSHSYEWLGIEPSWCPLVHHTELGVWDRGEGFYPNTSMLAKVNGTVESIKGPQAGSIRLGKDIRAFFVPGTRQWASRDVNSIVHFYLGFSYDGFRAWSVTLGPAPAATKTRPTHTTRVEKEDESAERPQEPALEAMSSAGRAKGASSPDDASAFVIEALAEAESRNGELLLTTLGARLVHLFGCDKTGGYFGYPNLSALIRSMPGVMIEGPAHRRVLRRTDILPSSQRPSALRTDVESFVFERVDRASQEGALVFVSKMGSELRQAFPGTPVHQRLGYAKLKEFFRDFRGLVMEGEATKETLRRRTTHRAG